MLHRKKYNIVVTAPSPDSFLNDFTVLCESKKSMRNHLIVSLLKSLIEKMACRANTKCATDFCNFYIALSSTSKNVFELVSGNLECPYV